MLIPPQKHHQSLWRHEPSHSVKIIQSFFAESLLLGCKKNMAISAIDVYWYFMVLPCISKSAVALQPTKCMSMWKERPPWVWVTPHFKGWSRVFHPWQARSYELRLAVAMTMFTAWPFLKATCCGDVAVVFHWPKNLSAFHDRFSCKK